MKTLFRISPLDTVVESEQESSPLWLIELRDIARGFCGALLLALPLLYTLEMWERARIIPNWDLAVLMVLTYLGNVGFALFNGFKPELRRKAAWFDALTAMGIGLVASVITLLIISRYTFGSSSQFVIKLLLLETVPTSFGASLAINQLGSRGQGGSKQPSLEDKFSGDFKKLLGTVLGALMFAFNIGPTIEPRIITLQSTWWHILAVMLFSIFVSFVMVYFAGFIEKDDNSGGVLDADWVATIVSYLVSLGVSALLLWIFGYWNFNTPFVVGLPWIIVMGYATTLGGAAGRLVI